MLVFMLPLTEQGAEFTDNVFCKEKKHMSEMKGFSTIGQFRDGEEEAEEKKHGRIWKKMMCVV